ncbi:hypothetical protein EDC52_110105 [Biostraticola tofi]|uniref:SET domain-containing protein n=1 Tax=Biostraticola tofi TaxID=466109 RepID=A0A4R3YQ77_9GAMM|nr:hypothetical protein EDC52_110105 [Biostraticola tofi]
MDNNPIHISLKSPISTKSDSDRCYASHVIETFLNKHTTPAARKTLYQQLDCRRIKSADVPTSEAVLIGQWGVFAASRIPEGSCIGIHSGMLINRKDYDNHIHHDGDFRIAMTVNNDKSSFFLEGDGITSKINSLFLFDDNGVPRAQQPEGYNVEVATFSGKTVKNKKIDIFGLFSLTDIAEGQELRLNYHYTPEIFSYMAEKQAY